MSPKRPTVPCSPASSASCRRRSGWGPLRNRPWATQPLRAPKLIGSWEPSFAGGAHPDPCLCIALNAAPHIAVLDDELDITELLANYLKSHGYRVSQVHDGRSLMALMAADTPALVLLDLGLPGEDGFSIARQLREHWRCGLVIVTGRGDSVDKVVGL